MSISSLLIFTKNDHATICRTNKKNNEMKDIKKPIKSENVKITIPIIKVIEFYLYSFYGFHSCNL